MAFTPEQADYYHDRGMMPDWIWVQQNGRSPEWNWEYQRKKMFDDIKRREKLKQLEEWKNQLEDRTLEAVMTALDQNASLLEDQLANDVVNKIGATFEGGSIHSEKLTNSSFSTRMAVMLGKALADAPFKLLEDIINEE